MRVYKELRELPEELEKWGIKALSKIESPEKAQEAAIALREKIDGLWNVCPSQSPEEKARYVLKKLGKAEVAAEELKETYALKSNKKVDKIAGIVCLVLSVLCSIHPFMTFFVYPQEIFKVGFLSGSWKASVGAGAGWVCAIVFLVFGMWLLLHNKGEEE